MNETQAAAFKGVTRLTELVDIRPVEMSAVVLDRPPESGAAIELALESSIRLERPSPDEFAVAARFQVLAREGEKQQYARFVYAAVATYKLVNGPSIGDEDLQLFAQHNSMIHLWPYFRTFVQSACGQLVIPPITIPVIRVTGGPALPWQRVENRGSAS